MKRPSHPNTVKTLDRKRPAWFAAGGIALALLIAGCGSTYGSSQSAGHGRTTTAPSTPKAASAASARSAPRPTRSTSPSTSTSSARPPAMAESTGIPQANGGDHDADNNGGPSDGDGNV